MFCSICNFPVWRKKKRAEKQRFFQGGAGERHGSPGKEAGQLRRGEGTGCRCAKVTGRFLSWNEETRLEVPSGKNGMMAHYFPPHTILA
jgi:hypothetical protein